jgi:hypothetical protein
VPVDDYASAVNAKGDIYRRISGCGKNIQHIAAVQPQSARCNARPIVPGAAVNRVSGCVGRQRQAQGQRRKQREQKMPEGGEKREKPPARTSRGRRMD